LFFRSASSVPPTFSSRFPPIPFSPTPLSRRPSLLPICPKLLLCLASIGPPAIVFFSPCPISFPAPPSFALSLTPAFHDSLGLVYICPSTPPASCPIADLHSYPLVIFQSVILPPFCVPVSPKQSWGAVFPGAPLFRALSPPPPPSAPLGYGWPLHRILLFLMRLFMEPIQLTRFIFTDFLPAALWIDLGINSREYFFVLSLLCCLANTPVFC